MDLKEKQNFSVMYRGRRKTCYLIFDEGKYWVMQRPSMLRDTYTEAELSELGRLRDMQALTDGDKITVDGREYTLKVQGDYSDLGYLVPVTKG